MLDRDQNFCGCVEDSVGQEDDDDEITGVGGVLTRFGVEGA